MIRLVGRAGPERVEPEPLRDPIRRHHGPGGDRGGEDLSEPSGIAEREPGDIERADVEQDRHEALVLVGLADQALRRIDRGDGGCDKEAGEQGEWQVDAERGAAGERPSAHGVSEERHRAEKADDTQDRYLQTGVAIVQVRVRDEGQDDESGKDDPGHRPFG